jgi:hypothetical protein
MPPEYEECPARDALKSIARAMPALAALLLLAACGEPSSSSVLDTRVAARMAPAQPCNAQARVEYLPNGARISMPDSALFTIGRPELSTCGQYAMASAVEAMLDPSIMQVVIEPGGDLDAPYAGLVRQRVGALKGIFAKASFPPYQPPIPVQTKDVGPGGTWGVVLMVAGNS